MELNLDYISTLSNEQLEGVLPQLSGEQYSSIKGILDRRQGLDTPAFEPEPIDRGFELRRQAASNIISGQFIRDIEQDLQKQNILPFVGPQNFAFGYSMPGTSGALGPRSNLDYKLQKNRRVKESLLKNLSEALDIDENKIDITSGLSDNLRRGLLSFQETPENKYNFLVDRYGQDNVSRFSIGNKPSFLVKEGDKQVLVDEQGAAFGDVLDAIRPGLVLGAEVGSAFIPGTLVPKVATKAPILSRSISAGAGAGLGELTSEVVESGSTADSISDFTGGVQLGQSALRGTGAALFDYGFSKPFSLVTKAFTRPGVPGTDLTQEDFLRVLKRLEERTGVDIAGKTTPSMRAGTDATLRESEVVDAVRQRAGTAISDDMQAPAVRNRIAFNDALQTIIRRVQGEEIPFEELSKIGRKNFEALSKEAADLAEETKESASLAVSKYFDNLAKNVTPTLERKTSKQLGDDLANKVNNIFISNKAEVDSLYDEALSMGDDIPNVSMLDIARRLLSIDRLSKELPTGANDRVIASFIPKRVLIELSKSKELSRQAKARLKKIAEFEENQELFQQGDQKTFMPLLEGIEEMADPGEPLELSFRQLVNSKKRINQVYAQAARGDFLEKQQLKAMIGVLDRTMEGMAKDANSDAFDVLKDANKLWKEKRLPLLEDRGLQAVLGNSRTKLSPSEISNALLSNRKGQVKGLIALRNASPDPDQFTQDIRDSAINAIFNATENQSDSLIDVTKLRQLIKNNDFVDEFFDAPTILRLNALTKLFDQSVSKNLLGLNNNVTVTPDTLRKYLQGSPAMTASEKSIISGRLFDEFKLSQRKNAIEKNEASRLLREGGGNVTTNINSTVNALLNLKSASEVKVFMDSLDDMARESIRASVRARIFDGASSGSGARTGERFGGARLPDANSDIFRNLRNSRSTEREVAKEILGEDGLQDVLDIISVLDRVGMEVQQQTSGLLRAQQAQLIGRGGSTSRRFMPRAILGFNLEVPINKFLAVAMANDQFVNLVNRGRPSDFTLSLLPAIYSSDNAFRIFTEMAAEDPRLIEAMDTVSLDSEVDNSDLLK